MNANRSNPRPKLRNLIGEPPMEWLSRHGWDIHCYDGYRVAKKLLANGTTREEVAETTRKLATKLGWYP